MCGNQIQKLPENLYQFRNQTGNSVLIIQKLDAVPPKFPNQKAKFLPSPICLNCVKNIITKFIIDGVQAAAKIVADEKVAEAQAENQPKPEQN